MRRLAKVLVECGATALCLALVVACTVVKLDKNKSAGSQYSAWEKTGKSFQADQYVAAEWDKQVLPAYEKDSIDFGTVLGALQADRKSAVVKYGVKKETGAVIYIFKVRGTAKVIKYDDSSRNGVLRVSMEPSGPGQGATLQVGPVIVGTTIRDSLDFIRFTDIGNQLQFADLANQLNARMIKDSVATLDLETIAGKRISFLGCFKLEEDQGLDNIVITPVKIERIMTGGAGK
jgi:predicted lipoprotein